MEGVGISLCFATRGNESIIYRSSKFFIKEGARVNANKSEL